MSNSPPFTLLDFKHKCLDLRHLSAEAQYFGFFKLLCEACEPLKNWNVHNDIKDQFLCEIVKKLTWSTQTLWQFPSQERYQDIARISATFGTKDILGYHLLEGLKYLVINQALKTLIYLDREDFLPHHAEYQNASGIVQVDSVILEIIAESTVPKEKDATLSFCFEKKLLTQFDFALLRQSVDTNSEKREELFKAIGYKLFMLRAFKILAFQMGKPTEAVVYPKILTLLQHNCKTPELYHTLVAELVQMPQEKDIQQAFQNTVERYSLSLIVHQNEKEISNIKINTLKI